MGDDDEGYAAAYAEQRRIDDQEIWVADEIERRALAQAEKDDFFDEDEPVADVLAAFEAGEKFKTRRRINDREVWLVTKAGTALTPELLASLVAEAEAGYDVDKLVVGSDFESKLEVFMADNDEALRRLDDDFFEEDEPVEDVLAAFEAGEKVQTEPPTGGVGWCAPSP